MFNLSLYQNCSSQQLLSQAKELQEQEQQQQKEFRSEKEVIKVSEKRKQIFQTQLSKGEIYLRWVSLNKETVKPLNWKVYCTTNKNTLFGINGDQMAKYVCLYENWESIKSMFTCLLFDSIPFCTNITQTVQMWKGL